MMNNTFIQQLRFHAVRRGKAHTWISRLTDEQILFIYSALRNKETANNIARQIQARWNVHTTSTAHSIAQGITKFKKRIAHYLAFPPDEKRGFSSSSFSDEDTLEALENIAELTRERIRKIITEEAQTGARYPYLNRDLQALAGLQKAIIKQKQFQLLHGQSDPSVVRRRELKEKQFKEGFDRFLNNFPDGGSRVVEIAEKFIERINRNSVQLGWDEDKGHYVVHRPEKVEMTEE